MNASGHGALGLVSALASRQKHAVLIAAGARVKLSLLSPLFFFFNFYSVGPRKAHLLGP